MSDQDTLLEFPCEFPIKAMGLADGTFDARVVEIIHRHVEDLPEGAIRRRPSAKGKYLSVTVTIRATSREQLDDIYRELTACEEVLMAL
jgi:putative lipoic acid-binding regulatory protein